MNQKKLDTYHNLCAEVYDLSKPLPPEDAYNFYRSYVEKAQGLTLEPMCGTGRFLIPLREEGFNIQGFDASDYMLEKLYDKAKLKNLKPNVWKCFVEDLTQTVKYNLIFIPSGSFCLITDPTAIKTALKVFYESLNMCGILLLEGETFKSVPVLDVQRSSKWYREDGKMILSSKYLTLNDNIFISTGKYEFIDEHNNILHSESEELKVRLYKPEELIALLKQAGFTEIRLIKAYNQDELPDINDESIIYECIK